MKQCDCDNDYYYHDADCCELEAMKEKFEKPIWDDLPTSTSTTSSFIDGTTYTITYTGTGWMASYV